MKHTHRNTGQPEPKKRSKGRRALVVLFEFVSALIMVTIFCAVMLGVLTLSFPGGATLGELVKYEHMLNPAADHAEFDLALPEGEMPLVALLSETRRRVQDRPAGAFAWSDSHRGTRLQQRHAVQTYSRSGATISFDKFNQLSLGENALLIVRDIKERRQSNRIRASVVIIEGEFHGSFDGSQESSVDLQLETQRGMYEIASAQGSPAEFTVRVNSDQSSTFSALEGDAVFQSEDRRVVIPANHSVSVEANGVVSAPVRLLAKPRLKSPRNGRKFAYQSRPPSVPFAWKPVEGAEGYRFVMAQDPKFRRIVHDEVLDSAEFTHGNLSAGTYYWRVTARGSAADGPSSKVKSLTTVRDTKGPQMDVEFPLEPQVAGDYLLRGKVDPGAKVFVRDLEVPIGDFGEFELAINLLPGLNLVVVEAIDPAGNAAYVSRVLNATAEP